MVLECEPARSKNRKQIRQAAIPVCVPTDRKVANHTLALQSANPHSLPPACLAQRIFEVSEWPRLLVYLKDTATHLETAVSATAVIERLHVLWSL